MVVFAGKTTPFVAVTHSKYGRINLSLLDQPIPNPGDRVRVEGITVKPGNVVSVSRWSLAGTSDARKSVDITLRAKPAIDSVSHPSSVVHDWKARAKKAEISLPDEILKIGALVDFDRGFREALLNFSFHFDE